MPTIAAGAVRGSSTGMTTSGINSGDYFRANVVQIGSSTAGSGVQVCLTGFFTDGQWVPYRASRLNCAGSAGPRSAPRSSSARPVAGFGAIRRGGRHNKSAGQPADFKSADQQQRSPGSTHRFFLLRVAPAPGLEARILASMGGTCGTRRETGLPRLAKSAFISPAGPLTSFRNIR